MVRISDKDKPTKSPLGQVGEDPVGDEQTQAMVEPAPV